MKVQRVEQITMGIYELRFEKDSFSIGGDCVIDLPDVFQPIAEIVICLAIIRPQGDRLTISTNGLVKSSGSLKCKPETVVDFRRAQFKSDGLAIGGDRLIKAPLGDQGIAKIVVGLRIGRIDGNRLAKGGQRFIHSTQFQQRRAEIAMGLRIVRSKSDGLTDQNPRRCSTTTDLRRDNPEKMQEHRHAWGLAGGFPRQHASADRGQRPDWQCWMAL